jgi:hypothetical protein
MPASVVVEKPDPRQGAYNIDFIDPLFAVVLHIGVVHALLDKHLHEYFFDDYSHDRITLRAMTLLFLGFLNVIFSWHGYHRSILEKPIRGGLRFYLDIVCLAIYLYIILMFCNGPFVAWLFVLQYFSYYLWDIAKDREWNFKPNARAAGAVTARWGVSFLLIALAWQFAPVAKEWKTPLESLYIALLYLCTLGYRIHKAKKYGPESENALLEALGNILFGPRPADPAKVEDAPPAAPAPPTPDAGATP